MVKVNDLKEENDTAAASIMTESAPVLLRRRRAVLNRQIAVIIMLALVFLIVDVDETRRNSETISTSDTIAQKMRRNYREDKGVTFIHASTATFETLSQKAYEFVMSRKAEYESVGMAVNWKLRGLGFLYTRQNMILAAQVNPSQSSVHIHNVFLPSSLHSRNSTDKQTASVTATPRDDCDELTLWVRVYGPEIFAGSAQPVPATESSNCYWKFDFEATVPGAYGVDAKVLLWNSKHRDYEQEQVCSSWNKKAALPSEIETNYSVHYGFQGFKFYYPEFACCEICSRLAPYCQYWSNPPAKIADPSIFQNGCELYYNPDTTPDDEIPKSWLLGDLKVNFREASKSQLRRHLASDRKVKAHSPHSAEPQHFLGCGWSNWFTLDFPCLSGAHDDQVFLINDTFHVASFGPSSAAAEEEFWRLVDNPSGRPMCDSNVELVGHSNGRWVREPFPNETTCPVKFAKHNDYSNSFNVYHHDGEHPHCYHREAISAIGNNCIEMNCRLIQKEGKWNSRAREGKWFGVWREPTCDYVEFTDDELQQCINSKKIKNLVIEGRSVAAFLQLYLKERLSTLTLYQNKSDPESVEIYMTTLYMLHRTKESNSNVRKALEKLDNSTDRKIYYYVSPYYTSSERETYTHVERMVDFNRIMESTLIPKGYKPLNAFDLSAAWTYDTATQRDGMHIIGPPMRMIITKWFHHICNDVVVGSRV